MKIATIGEALVEFMAGENGQSFSSAGIYHGPFPSGAPAIFVDQVAKQGLDSLLISLVGDDPFGQVITERLAKDGVDIRGVKTINSPTGTAFIRYNQDLSRDFVFNMTACAPSQLSLSNADLSLLDECTHLHVMGSSLFSFRIIDLIQTAIKRVKCNDGTISFDPNIRHEMLRIPEMRQAFTHIMHQTDFFLCQRSELSELLSNKLSQIEQINELHQRYNITHVVVKESEASAMYSGHGRVITQNTDVGKIVDLTGSGDCMGATFVAYYLQTKDAHYALKLAVQAASYSATQLGPMEGTINAATLK